MQKVTIKAYAVKHKLSMFNVMKMIKSGTVKSEEVEEEGKKVHYILLDDKTEEEVARSIIPLEAKQDVSLHEQVKHLTQELAKLREEVALLKRSLLEEDQ